MGAVEGLIFERWVPPHVDQNDVVTCCQVETWVVVMRVVSVCADCDNAWADDFAYRCYPL